jgi:hypothetical protein
VDWQETDCCAKCGGGGEGVVVVVEEVRDTRCSDGVATVPAKT